MEVSEALGEEAERPRHRPFLIGVSGGTASGKVNTQCAAPQQPEHRALLGNSTPCRCTGQLPDTNINWLGVAWMFNNTESSNMSGQLLVC